MPQTPSALSLDEGDVIVLAGTMKGAFFFRADADRRSWHVEGPHFPGEEIYALALDQRGGRRRIWAAPGNPFFGCTLRVSGDGGGSWSERDDLEVKFPEGSELSLKRIWQIAPGPDGEPDRMFLGAEPSCLFESGDGGATWAPVRGFLEHPHREHWTPGAGGMCMHTIVQDPTDDARLLVAISTGGVYRSDDGGASWQARNVGVRAEFLPDKHPEFGQCVHKVVSHPSRPGRLFLQNHWGLYRSDDWGDSWTDIANGVPSDFGFGMAMHPSDPDTVYIVPLESDQFRCTPEGRMRVYRTRDGGESWEPLTEGLPQDDAWETVLRDSLATDTADPAGVYVGTRSGDLYASSDDGDTWSLVHGGLPPVTCVKAAVIL